MPGLCFELAWGLFSFDPCCRQNHYWKRAKKCIFITTSDFSAGAEEFVSNIDSKIILIDGNHFASLMIDYGVGVATEAVYELKRIDSDFFTES